MICDKILLNNDYLRSCICEYEPDRAILEGSL